MTRITAPNAGCFGARAAVTIPFLQRRRAGPVNHVLGHRGFQDKSRFIAMRWYDGGIEGDVVSESTHLKDEAHKLVEQLPDDATWADLLRLVSERQRIDEGLVDLDEGRTWTSDQIREKLGLSK